MPARHQVMFVPRDSLILITMVSNVYEEYHLESENNVHGKPSQP
jgi:hypothetical protein